MAESLFSPDVLERAAGEWAALGVMSYHGMPWGWAPDLDKREVEKLRSLIRDLAVALSEASGVPMPEPEVVW